MWLIAAYRPYSTQRFLNRASSFDVYHIVWSKTAPFHNCRWREAFKMTTSGPEFRSAISHITDWLPRSPDSITQNVLEQLKWFCWPREVVSVFSNIRHRAPSTTNAVQSMPSIPISLRSVLILSSHLRQSHTSFQAQILYIFSPALLNVPSIIRHGMILILLCKEHKSWGFFFLLLFLVGWDWVHLVLRPLLAYCTSPR
jgi:hypothetical protein